MNVIIVKLDEAAAARDLSSNRIAELKTQQRTGVFYVDYLQNTAQQFFSLFQSLKGVAALKFIWRWDRAPVVEDARQMARHLVRLKALTF